MNALAEGKLKARDRFIKLVLSIHNEIDTTLRDINYMRNVEQYEGFNKLARILRWMGSNPGSAMYSYRGRLNPSWFRPINYSRNLVNEILELNIEYMSKPHVPGKTH
jgi:hypothetical protein